MTVLVKICGITDTIAVDAAVRAGADAVGFVFAQSVRELTPQRALEIASNVPAHVLRVAVMLHPSSELWEEVRDVFEPDVLQTDAADFADLEVPASIRRWPVLREGCDLRQIPDEFVYEGTSSGSGQRVDWDLAGEIALHGRMILAGGLRADNVAQAIREVKPFGVDVSSAVEFVPGLKDPKKIREFVEAAKAA